MPAPADGNARVSTAPQAQTQQDAIEAYFENQRTMTAVLIGWAVGSITTGWLWMGRTSKVLRGVGSQFVVWGAIDAVLGIIGLRNTQKDAANYYSKMLSVEEINRKAHGLRRLLWFNFGLDIIYMIVGRRMMRNENDLQRGAGIGVFVQGAFLFVFDALFADSIKPPKSTR